jgi:hypothetical protein
MELSKGVIMNLSKQMDLINRIETELPVESWIVDGIHIWPLIRITLGDYLSFTEIENSSGKKQGYFLQKISQLKSLTRGHANYIRAYITDFKNNAQIRQKVNAVFLGDQVSRVFINGTWYDRFCDPFISVFNKNGKECLHMEPLHIYFTPRYGPSVFIQPQLDYLTIKSLLVRPHKTPIKVDGFNEFKQILKINNINLQFFSLMHLAQYACRLRLYANFFRKIFETVNPEIGFVVSYYGLIGMAFNLACRQIGIPSVDIQHGVQGDLHRAYGRWNKLPKAGYELLPTIFWVWSEVEAKAINNWNEKMAPAIYRW